MSPCHKLVGIKLEMACFGSLAMSGDLWCREHSLLMSKGRDTDINRAFFPLLCLQCSPLVFTKVVPCKY